MKSLDLPLNRRHFMTLASGAGVGLFAAGWALPDGPGGGHIPNKVSKNIGVQLYTVRDLMETDFEGTVERVAQIGYKEVEFAGYFGREPAAVGKLLEGLGLEAPSVHVGLQKLRADLSAEIGIAQTVGHTFITVPSLPGAYGGGIADDAWKGFADEFNEIARVCEENGLRFAYHNHDWEFRSLPAGNTGFDVLLEETDSDLVSFEMDLMWIMYAGRDPFAYFESHPGRFVMWHVKDIKDLENVRAKAETMDRWASSRLVHENMAAVGLGGIHFKPIFAAADQAGLEHYFVENDHPADAMADIRASHENLAELVGAF